MSDWITGLSELEALYGTPGGASTRKVTPRLTASYRRWLEQSRFCVLATVGPEGTDASPRGDDGPVVQIRDDSHLLLPDWRGNNRIDSLRNIVRDPWVSLMFMVSGSDTVLRVNGEARVSASADLLGLFEREGAVPRTVVVVRIGEVYFQCARALMRAKLWQPDMPVDLPKPGEMLSDASGGAEGGADYDAAWPARARTTMW